MTDVISFTLSLIREKLPDAPLAVVNNIEQTVRLHFGGEEQYIARRHFILESRKQLINDGLRAGHSIAQIEQLHGIPRRTIYRILNKK